MCARSSAESGRYHRVERSGSARAGVPTERQKSDLKTNNLCGGWISGALQTNKKGDSCTWNSITFGPRAWSHMQLKSCSPLNIIENQNSRIPLLQSEY